MKSSKLIAAVVATVLVGGSTVSLADNDKCKGVRFRITNQHPTKDVIKIIGVKYHNVVNNKDVTVNLAQTIECQYNVPCTTKPEDLKDIEGTAMKHIHFVFRYTEHDGDASDPVISKEFEPDNTDCRADRVYGKGPLGFVIGGA